MWIEPLFRFVQVRKLLLEILNLGKIVDYYVNLIRMMRKIVLVVALRFIKRLERRHFSYDRRAKHFGLVELIDISLRNALLFFITIEDRRALLRPRFGPLAFQFSWVMCVRKEDFEKLAISDF